MYKYLHPTAGCILYSPPPPPTEDIRNSKGKGVQEEAISIGVGFHSSMSFFSRDFEARIIVFIDDLTSLTVG